MKTKMSVTLMLTGLFLAGTAGAQQPLDTQRLADTDVDAASCAAVSWHQDLLAAYPRAGLACHEVIVVNGERWARFETVFQQENRGGSVRSNFRDRQGRSMGSLTMMPAHDQRVLIDGREYAFSELQRGQVLNVYVPEGAYAFALTPGAPVAQRAQVVEIVQQPAAQPTRVVATQLPRTAGPLPFLALGGLLSLLGGLGLTIRRRLVVDRG